MISSANVATNGASYLQVFHDTIAFRQFVKNTYLYSLADVKRTKPMNTNTYRFWLINAATFDATSTVLTEGQAPADEVFNITAKDVSYTQYGAYAKLTDVALTDAPIDLMAEVVFEFGRRFAEVLDIVVQNTLNTSSNKIYGDGSVSATANITTAMKATSKLLAAAFASLKSKAAPTFDGGYIAVLHPYCAFDLLTETATGGFIDISKYKNPERIVNGEIGSLFGIRIVVSANVQKLAATGASSQDIYPIYVFGKNSYGIVEENGGLKTKISNIDNITPGNPLGQTATVGMKTRFGVIIIKSEALLQLQVSTGAIVV